MAKKKVDPLASRSPDEDLDEDLPADVSGLKGWSKTRHFVDPAMVKVPARRITINIDSDIIAILKAEARRGGPPYQVAINQALREHLHYREGEGKRKFIQDVITALDDPNVRQKIRSVGTSSSRR